MQVACFNLRRQAKLGRGEGGSSVGLNALSGGGLVQELTKGFTVLMGWVLLCLSEAPSPWDSCTRAGWSCCGVQHCNLGSGGPVWVCPSPWMQAVIWVLCHCSSCVLCN